MRLLARATSQPFSEKPFSTVYKRFCVSYLLRQVVGKEQGWGRGRSRGRTLPLTKGLFAVFTLCPGVRGADLAASFAWEQHNLVTRRMRKPLCPWPAASLCVLCYCHTCARKEKKKKGNTLSPEVKAAIFLVVGLDLWPGNLGNLYLMPHSLCWSDVMCFPLENPYTFSLGISLYVFLNISNKRQCFHLVLLKFLF